MPEASYPRFRPDLVVRRIVESGDASYTIYDPLTGQYYRQDSMMHDLCALLDGKRNEDEVLDELHQRYPQYSFPREFLDETLEGLRKADFLEDSFRRNLLLTARALEERKRMTSEAFKNILHIRLGAFDPLPALLRLYPYVRPVFSRAWVIGTAIAFLFAMSVLWDRRDAVVGGLYSIFSLPNSSWVGLLVLYLALFGTIVAHEFGHGLCCVHYGGRPRDLGFQLFFFMPGMFCNVSDIYFFERRWPRAAVALAGGYIEVQIFALATFAWVATPPDLLAHDIAYRVMLFSGVSGLIFNYNPLIKMDGYYVLLSWLDIPDLQERSFAWLGKRIGAFVTRKPPPRDRSTRRERRIFAVYGVASIVYSALFTWAMLLVARRFLVGHFRELGVILFLFLFYYLTRRLWKAVGRGVRLLLVERAGTIRRNWALVGGGGAFAVALLLIPLPHTLKLNAVLEGLDARPVRAPVAGRVEAVLVSEGAPVRAGTVVALLSRPDLSAAREEKRADWETAVIGERRDELREGTAAPGGVEAASASRGQSEHEGRGAWLAAPTSGRLLNPNPISLIGRHLEPGDSALAVGRVDSLRVRLSVGEREVGDLAVGERVRLRMRADPSRTWSFLLEAVDLEPRGAERPEQARVLSNPETKPTGYEAWGRIDNPGEELRPGMSGVVRLRARPLSLFQRLARLYARLVRADFWL